VRNELELIPVSHVDEVLYEALMCRRPQDLSDMLALKTVRDELLYADEKKREDGVGGSTRDEKGAATGVVTH
jgi:hypothetical protein